MRRTMLAGAAAAVLLLAGCATSETETTQAPDETITVYSGRNEALMAPVLQQFTEATGIKLDVRYGDTAGLAAQLIEEGDRTPAQVFIAQDAGALGALAAADMLAALPEDLIEVVPQEYRAKDGTWTALTGRARVMVYNPNKVEAAELPKSVDELTDPKWAGRVAIAPSNASFQSFVTALREVEGDQAAEQWLAGMKANGVKTYEKNGQILDAVDAGAVDIGLVNHYYWFEKAAEVGEDAMVAQVAYFEPGDPGSLVNIAGAAILRTAQDDAAARKLVEFLLSEQAQTYFATETFEYPMDPSVPTAPGLVPLADLEGPKIDLADLADLPKTIEMIQRAGLL